MSEIESTILETLRRHDIGAFNGSQVACGHCRLWMKTDKYHQHLAELIARHVATTATPAPAAVARATESAAVGGAGLEESA